jgi:hypothetical protein
MRHSISTTARALFATLLFAAPALSQNGFVPEDVFVVTTHASTDGFTVTPGILKVAGGAGAASHVATLSTVLGSAQYDSFRKKIVFGGGATAAGIPNESLIVYSPLTGLEKINIGTSTTKVCAPVGDGRIYFFDKSLGNSDRLKFVDAAGIVHTVLNASGTAPYVEPSITHMIYEPATNSLFVNLLGAFCSPVVAAAPAILKIPLNANGTQLAGSTTYFDLCAIPTPGLSTDTWEPTQFGKGPNGKLTVGFDNNQNLLLGRMVVFDPVTLAYSAWAKNGPNDSSKTVCGYYHPASNTYRILEAFTDKIRAYAQGETGDGTSVATGISTPGNVGGLEYASAVLIPQPSVAGVSSFGSGTPGCNGSHEMFANSVPKIGNVAFQAHATNTPASALGLGLVGNAADFNGTDVFGLGFLVHIGVFTSTELLSFDALSNPAGIGVVAAPIPPSPFLVGMTYHMQTFWAWSGCTPPAWSGLSSSEGLSITIQP